MRITNYFERVSKSVCFVLFYYLVFLFICSYYQDSVLNLSEIVIICLGSSKLHVKSMSVRNERDQEVSSSRKLHPAMTWGEMAYAGVLRIIVQLISFKVLQTWKYWTFKKNHLDHDSQDPCIAGKGKTMILGRNPLLKVFNKGTQWQCDTLSNKFLP